MARIEIKSEITGTVWEVKTRPGDTVDSGDILLVIESMKMEIPGITEDAGTVMEIRVWDQTRVDNSDVISFITSSQLVGLLIPQTNPRIFSEHPSGSPP